MSLEQIFPSPIPQFIFHRILKLFLPFLQFFEIVNHLFSRDDFFGV